MRYRLTRDIKGEITRTQYDIIKFVIEKSNGFILFKRSSRVINATKLETKPVPFWPESKVGSAVITSSKRTEEAMFERGLVERHKDQYGVVSYILTDLANDIYREIEFR